jgi:hypothetical protein
MKFKSSLTRSDHLLHFHYLNHKDFLTWPRETPEPSKSAVASQEWPIVDYSFPTTIPLSQCFLLTLQHWSQFYRQFVENVEYSCSSRTASQLPSQIWKSRDTFDSTPAQTVGVFSHEELDISPSYPNTPLLCLEKPEGESQVQSHMTAIWIRGEIMTKFSVSNVWTRTTPVGVSICWPNGSRQNVQQSRPSRPPPPSHNVYKEFLSTMSATWTMGLGLSLVPRSAFVTLEVAAFVTSELFEDACGFPVCDRRLAKWCIAQLHQIWRNPNKRRVRQTKTQPDKNGSAPALINAAARIATKLHWCFMTAIVCQFPFFLHVF